MTDLSWLTAAEGAAAIRAGRLRATDWIEAVLDRIDAVDPGLNAWLHVDRAGALDAARRADATPPSGWLHGVPVGIKDVIAVADLPWTGHSRLHAGRVAPHDAALVARLRAAGAIILGKQAQYELSYGGPSFDLPAPPARNPWDPARIPGGSSSGSAGAVAGGMGPLAVGTDAGGSIRQPAAFCGLVGLKPTAGLVPHDGVMPMTLSLGSAGPIARTALDAALLLDALARTDTAAWVTQGVSGLRMAPLDGWIAHAAAPVQQAIAAALAGLSRQGIVATRTSAPDVNALDACGRVILLAEAFSVHEAQLRRDPMIYGRLARLRFALGAFLSAADLLAAQRQRGVLSARMDQCFDDADVLIAPGEATIAPRFDQASAAFPFTAAPSLRIAANVTGHPAAVAPIGLFEGMPLSIQIIGRRGADGTVLAVAAAVQRACGTEDFRPPAPPPAASPP